MHSAQPTNLAFHQEIHGTEDFAITSSVDGRSILMETQFVWTRLPVNTTRLLSVGVPFPLWELLERRQSLHQSTFRGSTPDFSLRLSPNVFSTRRYFRKTARV